MMLAGEYYVGDLCYVMTDEEWDQFCSITIKNNECLEGEFEMPDGRRFATYGTKYGDGGYYDQNHHEYSVDAGLIGCIRLKDINAQKYGDLGRLGNIVNFPHDFETSGGRNENYREWNGVIKIGHIHIDTDPQDSNDWED